MDPLRVMFDHHEWATLKLIDYCIALPPERLSATVPGTRDTVLATLVHLVAADQRYLEGMTGLSAEQRVHESMELSIEDLRAPFVAQAARWQRFVDRAGELDVTLPARGPYPEVPHAEDLLLLQAIHHGNDHRTQVCTIFGALGAEVPELDGWHFWEETRRLGTG